MTSGPCAQAEEGETAEQENARTTAARNLVALFGGFSGNGLRSDVVRRLTHSVLGMHMQQGANSVCTVAKLMYPCKWQNSLRRGCVTDPLYGNRVQIPVV
jgi:hypothetical protein